MPQHPNGTKARKKTRNWRSCPLSFHDKDQTTNLRPENIAQEIMERIPFAPPSISSRSTSPVAMAALHLTVRNKPPDTIHKDCPVIQAPCPHSRIADLDVLRRTAHGFNRRVTRRGHAIMMTTLLGTNRRLLTRKEPVPDTA